MKYNYLGDNISTMFIVAKINRLNSMTNVDEKIFYIEKVIDDIQNELITTQIELDYKISATQKKLIIELATWITLNAGLYLSSIDNTLIKFAIAATILIAANTGFTLKELAKKRDVLNDIHLLLCSKNELAKSTNSYFEDKDNKNDVIDFDLDKSITTKKLIEIKNKIEKVTETYGRKNQTKGKLLEFKKIQR